MGGSGGYPRLVNEFRGRSSNFLFIVMKFFSSPPPSFHFGLTVVSRGEWALSLLYLLSFGGQRLFSIFNMGDAFTISQSLQRRGLIVRPAALDAIQRQLRVEENPQVALQVILKQIEVEMEKRGGA